MRTKAKKTRRQAQKERLARADRTAVRRIVAEPYSRVLVPDPSGGFSASIAEFPGCVSQGETVAEAYSNLEQAATNWVLAAQSQGQPIPPPNSERPSASGKFPLRMPRGLHTQLIELAERDDVSVNQYIVSALSRHVGLRLGESFARARDYLRGVPLNFLFRRVVSSPRSIWSKGGLTVEMIGNSASTVYSAEAKRISFEPSTFLGGFVTESQTSATVSGKN